MKALVKLTAAVAMLFAMSATSFAATVGGQCGTNLYWSFDTETGALVITGYGDMNMGCSVDNSQPFACYDYGTGVYYYNRNGQLLYNRRITCTYGANGDWYTSRMGAPFMQSLAPWAQYITQITSVTLPEGIKSIAGTAFCGATNLTSIQFPSTLEYLGGECFAGSGLTSIDIPGTVKYIEKFAFYRCRQLTSLTLNEGTVRLRANSFGDCTSLSNIVCNAVDLVPQISNYYGGSFSGLVDDGNHWINDMTIVIPYEAKDKYEGSQWGTFLASAHVVIAGSLTVNVIVNNELWGTATGGGTRTYGQTAEIYASAYEGYEFLRWNDNSSTTNPREIVVTSDTTIQAVFGEKIIPKYTVKLTAIPAEGGTFAGGGTYTQGDEATTVEAIPNYGYEFVKWSDNETTAKHSSFTMSSDMELTATFRKKSFTITLTADGGTISGATSGNSYEYQTVLNLTATADGCHDFVKWEDESTASPRSYTVTKNDQLTAIFSTKSYALTVQSDDEDMGTVSNTTGVYDCGSSVTMTATPKTGYHFKQWTKGGANVGTNPSLTITISEAATYTATFEPNQYTITTETNGGNGTGSVTGGGTYNFGATPTLKATAGTGSTFTKWMKNGNDYSTDASTTINVDGNATYTAVFTLNKYTITTNTTGNGSVTGGGPYDYGTSVTLTATANTGSTFTKWSDGNTENPRTVTVTGNATYTAEFTLNQYTITATKDGNGNGSVSGGNTYNYGATATLTATVGAGSSFDGWYKNSVKVSENAQYSFTVSESAEYKAKFNLNKYTITVQANKDEYGTVSGGGSFDYGTRHTLTATANTGSPFAKWLRDGNEISYETSTEITVDGDALYIAVFVLNEYTIGTDKSGDGSGTVVGAGPYNHGSQVTLTATANTGSTFNGWYKGNQQVSTDAQYTFTATESGTYTANFTLNEYTITTYTSGTGSGTVSGGGQHKYGTNATLTASANTGSTFTKWSDGVESATRQVDVTGDASYTAVFTLNQYTISTATEGNGTAIGGHAYDYGTTATLTATAGTGSSFEGWYKNGNRVSTNAQYSFTVSESAEYTAKFTLNKYTITVVADDPNNGSVTGGGEFDYGTQTSISASPGSGYNFGGWDDGITANPRTITVSETKTYTAIFTQKTYYGVSVDYNSEMGTVTGTGSFEENTVINNLVATPKTGYFFEKWSDGKTSATYPTFTLTGNVSLSAIFKPIAYTITGIANPATYGNVTVEGGSSHDYNTDVTITATPNYGYKFVNWEDGGATTPVRTIRVSGDESFTANFAKLQFHIYANSDNEAMGTVSGAGNYDYLEEATLTATPKTGYVFSKWQKDGSDYSTNASITVSVEAEATYTAFFKPDRYAITIEKEGEGTTSGNGTYDYNTNATLTATAADGYTFSRWEKDGVQVSTESSYTVKVTAAATYKAVFTLNSYNIAVTTSGNGSGIVTGNNLYYHGDDVTLVATENTGSSFSGWYKGGVKVSDNNTYSFKATESTTYTAMFTLNKYTLNIVANNNNYGTVSGSGTYDYGTEVDIEASPNTGCEFVEWAEDHLATPSRKVTVHASSTYTAVFKLQQFYISATSADITMGSVSGSGTYNYGETATIKATPEHGYEFEKWNDESTTDEISFTVTKAENYVASFKKGLFTVTVAPNHNDYGTVTGVTSGNKYEFMTELTITATANDHYTFVGWSDHVAEATRQITVNDDINLTAEFEPERYIISVHSDNEEMGSTTGSNTYNYLDNVEIAAIPNYGYDFVKWSDGSTEATRNFTATESVDLTATFAVHKFDVTLTSSNIAYGSVSGSGQYDYNSEATISATAEYGYTFDGWSDGSTDASRTITVTKDITLEASFAIGSFYIGTTLNDTTMGDITGEGYYNYLETATLIATPRYGYEFISWSNDLTDSLITIEVTKNDIFSALFKPLHFDLTLIADNAEMGIVKGDGSFIYLDTVEICATPNDGYKFLRWDDGETDSLRTIVIKSDTTFTAMFAKEDAKVYTVSLTVNDENMGTVSGASDYIDGDIATISATANPGYEFTNWSDGDTTRTREIVVVCDTTLMAYFKALPTPADYVVSHNLQALDGSFTSAITDTLSGIVDSLTVAVAKTFEGFTAQPFEQVIIANESVSPTVVNINYKRNSYKLTWNFEGGTATGDYTNGNVLFGAPIVAPVPTKEGFEFVSWNNLQATMPASDLTCTAVWKEEPLDEPIYFTVPETVKGCEKTHIEATNLSSANIKFIWSVNGVVDESQTGATFIIPENAASTGVISVTGSATSSNGHTSTLSYQIQYNIQRQITRTLWDDVITVVNTDSMFASYRWYHNGELIDTTEYYNEVGGLTGKYYLVATTQSGVEICSCESDFGSAPEATMTVYPNPTVDDITVAGSLIETGSTISVIDGNGKEWLRKTVENNGSETIRVSQMPQGMYIVKVGGKVVSFIKL